MITYAIESMRRYWNSEFRLIDWTSNGILIALEFGLALGAGMAVVGNSRILHAARSTVLLAGWLIPVMLIDFIWGHPQAPAVGVPGERRLDAVACAPGGRKEPGVPSRVAAV